MFAKLTLLALFAVAVSGNPYADSGEWTWIHKRLTVSPNFKALPWKEVVDSVVPQQPKYPSGTVKVDGCGTAPGAYKSPKIVGGSETTPHKFPWQVALYIDGMYFCGGSVISSNWVMTAAHCMDGANSVEIVLGAHDLSENEASQQTVVSTDFFVHENWNAFTLSNDISMIRLPSSLSFNDYIQPVCLPSGSDLGAGVSVTPSGWGKISDSALGVTDVLREVTVPTTTNAACEAYYGSVVTDDMICIDASGGQGTCNGDSGGPMNHDIGGGVTETRGIVSFGSSAGCESGAPDSFTRVNHYLGWIQDNTGVTI